MISRTRRHALKLGFLLLLGAPLVALLTILMSKTGHTVAIQQWTTTTPYPIPLASRYAVAVDDYIYVVGGKSGATGQATNRVYSAKTKIDGTIDSWTQVSSLPYPNYLHAVGTDGSHIYMVGGWDEDKAVTRSGVWRARVGPAGQLDAWEFLGNYPSTSSVEQRGINLHDAVVARTTLYVVGGWNGSEALNTVYYAGVSAAGIGQWLPGPSLPKSLYRLSVTANQTHLFAVGGVTAGKAIQDTVYAARINADGSLGAWQSVATLPSGRFYAEAVVHDNQLTVLGGAQNVDAPTALNQVLSAPINPNGSLGAWVTEAPLPKALFRLAAVTVRRFGSDYIYVIGGLENESRYSSSVYHSAVPPTPTPTPTATATPALSLRVENQPGNWIGPGDELTYVLNYSGNGSGNFDTASIVDTVPENVQLIPGSITVSGSGTFTVTGDGGPGTEIQWSWPNGLPADADDSVSFRVRRPVEPTPAVPPSLEIRKSGPPTATAGDTITYTLTVTNHVPIDFADVLIDDRLPSGATYVSGGEYSVDEGVVRWTIPSIAADAVVQVQLTVTANQTIVNGTYGVQAAGTTRFKGLRTIVTRIGATVPPPQGDGVTITNSTAIVRWTHGIGSFGAPGNSVRNPKFDLFLPTIAAD